MLCDLGVKMGPSSRSPDGISQGRQSISCRTCLLCDKGLIVGVSR